MANYRLSTIIYIIDKYIKEYKEELISGRTLELALKELSKIQNIDINIRIDGKKVKVVAKEDNEIIYSVK